MPVQTYRFNVGSFQCAVIRDGGHMGKASFLFTNAPETEVDKALQAHAVEPDQLASTWNCLLVDTGDEKVLIDTGIGSGAGPAEGLLPVGLTSLGVEAAQIDVVVLSHAHPDHIGGCTDSDGRLAFPNARFVMARKEWEFWTSEANLSQLGAIFGRFARRNLPPLRDRVELLEEDNEIRPGMAAVMAPGHTPGHMGVVISSAGEQLFFLGDAVLHPIHIEHPSWIAGVDMDSEQVVTTRRRLLDRAAAEDAPVLFYHFDFPALGRVKRSGSSWHWESLPQAN